MIVTLGDTLNLVASLVLVLGIARILRALGRIHSLTLALLVANHIKQTGPDNLFKFELVEGPNSGGGE